MKRKFNLGDHVIIDSKIEDRRIWVMEMNKYLGADGIITSVCEYEGGGYYVYRIKDTGGWWFPESSLVLYEEDVAYEARASLSDLFKRDSCCLGG